MLIFQPFPEAVLRPFEFKRNNFDLIRLIAALQVTLVHGHKHFEVRAGGALIEIISVFPGVPIFFVISGFLISASWERSGSLSSYVQNRMLRIFPALWGCLLFSVGTVFIFYPVEVGLIDFTKWFVAQVSVGQFYNPDFLRGYGVGVLNGSLWTIPVELQFYFVLPLLYVLFERVGWRRLFLIGCFVALVVLNQWYLSLKDGGENLVVKLMGVTVLPYLYIFLLGVLLQRNLSFVKNVLANRAVLWLVVYLLSIGVSLFAKVNYSGNYLNPVSATLISFLTISLAYSFNTKYNNVLRGNDVSYGIYIYHMVIVNVLVHTAVFSPAINLVVMLLCTIVLAVLSWKWIEKPALSLKRYSVRASGKDKP